MAKETMTPEVVSRQLIELSLTKPPVHSFNRQLVRIVVDTVGAMGATLWLLRENELILCEEIEQVVGAVRGIQIPEQQQQQALRATFEQGEVVVLPDGLPGSVPSEFGTGDQRSLVFIPVVGLRGNLGVLRLIFPPVSEAVLRRQIQLAETLSGYYSLYSAQRILTVQHEERQDIDRLSKAILELQHYTFSRQLREVVVNSAVEIARLDRVVLVTADKDGELRLGAVSSVSEPNKKGAWARLVCELGEIVLQTGKPLHFLAGMTSLEDIEDEELRRQVNSYVAMTGSKSLLVFPLTSGDVKVGVLFFENYAEQTLTNFERVLCTVFAAHAASALANRRLFEHIPFSGFYAKKIESGDELVRRGRSRARKAAKWAVGLLIGAAVVWFVGFMPVDEKIGAKCFVQPEEQRTVTARIAGEIEQVHFDQGDSVEQGDLLVKLRTDELELELSKELANAKNIEARIVKLRGEEDNERDLERRGSLLAEMRVLGHSARAKEAEIELLRARIRDCHSLAPIAGTVLQPEEPETLLGIVVREGEPLCRIGSIAERVMVRIAVPAERITEVEEGLVAEIRLRPLISKEPIRATVEQVAERSVTHKNANVFMTDIYVDNSLARTAEGDVPQYVLKPGMTGKAKIIRPEKSTYFSIYGRLLHRKLKYWLY